MAPKIYVASSWRNLYQPQVIERLRSEGYEVYDFRHPREGDNGFQWSEIDPNWKSWDRFQYRDALFHPIAARGFKNDFEAMQWASGCVLVLPCGRSAHLEAGWFVGQGKPVYVLQLDAQEPELMYKMTAGIFCTVEELLIALQSLIVCNSCATETGPFVKTKYDGFLCQRCAERIYA